MPKYRILTYDLESESGHKLRKELGDHPFIKPNESSYRYNNRDIVVNWGIHGNRGYPVVNNFHAVYTNTSKLASFEAFRAKRIPHPLFSRSRHDALLWQSQGATVYARAYDSGMRGEGITVVHPREVMPNVLFYTKGFTTTREFRVYVAFGTVLDIREKQYRRGDGDGTWNPDTGPCTGEEIRAGDDWMYCRVPLDRRPPNIKLAAVGAIRAVGLDFGGVDVAVNQEQDVCVFETNSAPWLPDSTAVKLANAIQDKYGVAT